MQYRQHKVDSSLKEHSMSTDHIQGEGKKTFFDNVTLELIEKQKERDKLNLKFKELKEFKDKEKQNESFNKIDEVIEQRNSNKDNINLRENSNVREFHREGT